MRTIELDGPVDWSGFVHATRALVAARVLPAELRWSEGGSGDHAQAAGLFDNDGRRDAARTLPDAPALRLPATFVARAKLALLHADAARLDLLYRLVWRLHDDRRLAHDALDPDWLKLDAHAAAVRREIHKMHAFVRFRKVALPPLPTAAGATATQAEGDEDAPVRHVAWFEPQHHIVEAAAPFFVRRFAQMDWAILTPRASIAWDQRTLRFAPGARREDAPAADADEALWLAYYASIFNPARVKQAAMKKEMPRRYWSNLPEAQLIAPLLAAAPERVQRMVEAEASERQRRRASAVVAATDAVATHAGSSAQDAAAVEDRSLPAAAAAAPPQPLAQLAERAAHCRACPIGQHATQTVWGRGAPDAALMLVGEQPGDREDLAGASFVGPAGQLLQRALQQLGWAPERLYLTNAVKHFKFELRGKRRIHKTASQHEASICAGWLEAEIASVQPRALIALGATAARSLLGRPVAIGAYEGEWLLRGTDARPVLIVPHPAALLRRSGFEPERDEDEMFRRWVAHLGRAGAYVERVAGDQRFALPASG